MASIYEQLSEAFQNSEKNDNLAEMLQTILAKNVTNFKKPKKPPNAFIIFKGKLEIPESELKGASGKKAKIAKEKWDAMSDIERQPFINEYNELKIEHEVKLREYYNFLGISETDVAKNKNKSKNADTTPKKRGRPRKNKEEVGPSDEEDETKIITIETNDGPKEFILNKTTNSIFNCEGKKVGKKMATGYNFF